MVVRWGPARMNPKAPILKIAVMADGRITADAKPATIDSLRSSLKELARLEGTVWYYREDAHSKAPPEALEVVQAVIENRLPVLMSTRPDFSDSFGVDSKPAALQNEERFKQVRTKAAQGLLVMVRPDGRYLLIPALRKENVKAESVAAVERIIPSTTKRNVAVIGDTNWGAVGGPDLRLLNGAGRDQLIRAANEAIPFFGILAGFASIGHSVWIFDGADDILESGCREADVLIVDSASLARLPSGWQDKARGVMRKPQILVHDRASYQLRHVGMNP